MSVDIEVKFLILIVNWGWCRVLILNVSWDLWPRLSQCQLTYVNFLVLNVSWDWCQIYNSQHRLRLISGFWFLLTSVEIDVKLFKFSRSGWCQVFNSQRQLILMSSLSQLRLISSFFTPNVNWGLFQVFDSKIRYCQV